ncbi:MAG TPA: hypothetical protein VGE52_11305 [Pirellulales bacterium]
MFGSATRSFLQRQWRALQRDERGNDVLSNIMLLALAALVVVGLIAYGGRLWKWLKGTTDRMEGDGDTLTNGGG